MKFLFVVIALLLSGCSEQYTLEKIAGKYLMCIGDAVDTIDLSPDGTYIHGYKDKSGRDINQTGAWNIENLQAGYSIILNDFEIIQDNKLQMKGIYILLIDKSMRNTYLITNIDLKEGYKKQSDK